MHETVVNTANETTQLDPRTDSAPARLDHALAPVRLGPLTVGTPVMLSPMAGVTNWPFRVLCEEYGPDGLYVAEMITARALVARNPKRCGCADSRRASIRVRCSCTASIRRLWNRRPAS